MTAQPLGPEAQEATAGYMLEIEAEGLPRRVGLFAFDFQAHYWAEQRIRDGSWSVVPITSPWTIPDTKEHL